MNFCYGQVHTVIDKNAKCRPSELITCRATYGTLHVHCGQHFVIQNIKKKKKYFD